MWDQARAAPPAALPDRRPLAWPWLQAQGPLGSWGPRLGQKVGAGPWGLHTPAACGAAAVITGFLPWRTLSLRGVGGCSTASQWVWQIPQREAQVQVWPTPLTPQDFCSPPRPPLVPGTCRVRSGARLACLVIGTEPSSHLERLCWVGAPCPPRGFPPSPLQEVLGGGAQALGKAPGRGGLWRWRAPSCTTVLESCRKHSFLICICDGCSCLFSFLLRAFLEQF